MVHAPRFYAAAYVYVYRWCSAIIVQIKKKLHTHGHSRGVYPHMCIKITVGRCLHVGKKRNTSRLSVYRVIGFLYSPRSLSRVRLPLLLNNTITSAPDGWINKEEIPGATAQNRAHVLLTYLNECFYINTRRTFSETQLEQIYKHIRA